MSSKNEGLRRSYLLVEAFFRLESWEDFRFEVIAVMLEGHVYLEDIRAEIAVCDHLRLHKSHDIRVLHRLLHIEVS